jgi:hypothetical protein
VYAMTVHKSQGSEFEQVLVVTPNEPSPVLSRELLYTALTRAKREAMFYGVPEVFAAAVGRRLRRSSGLRDRLWVEPSGLDGRFGHHFAGLAHQPAGPALALHRRSTRQRRHRDSVGALGRSAPAGLRPRGPADRFCHASVALPAPAGRGGHAYPDPGPSRRAAIRFWLLARSGGAQRFFVAAAGLGVESRAGSNVSPSAAPTVARPAWDRRSAAHRTCRGTGRRRARGAGRGARHARYRRRRIAAIDGASGGYRHQSGVWRTRLRGRDVPRAGDGFRQAVGGRGLASVAPAQDQGVARARSRRRIGGGGHPRRFAQTHTDRGLAAGRARLD